MHSVKPYRSLVARFCPRVHRSRSADHYLLRRIRLRATALANLQEDEILGCARQLRSRLQTGDMEVLSRHAVVESFALTAEALRRTTGKSFYDCQLLGGLALATGAIAEMQTGEGKTITCGLAAVLFGLTGKGVHVATTNDYLAQRDHDELSPVFNSLGMTSALNSDTLSPADKQHAYAQDVTYGTGFEFGFDFLRDQLALRNRPSWPLGTRFLSRLRGIGLEPMPLIQRPLGFAIIDEADSVLIDEAATPLILSGSSQSRLPGPQVYGLAMQVADQLQEELDYHIDWAKRSLRISARGWRNIHDRLTREVQKLLMRPWSQYVEQSLQARLILKRDVDYIVSSERVIIVDSNTGRIHEDRKWKCGLHQAIEMRENVPLTQERHVEARITRQRYFDFYEKITGMTGTARGNEAELLEFYDLPVVAIQRNQPSQMKHIRSRFFATESAKYRAIVDNVIERAAVGQPVLVGTRSITQSRQIGEVLQANDQPHVVLNGTQDQPESKIIAAAGQAGTVTIATNMAGRGTDIKLSKQARQAGGLHVIVAEHHPSRRIDRQLIGRSGRQSDPGSCQFFVSADDEIIRRFAPSLGLLISNNAHRNSGECRTSFDHHIRALQKNIERHNFSARRDMVIHDRWMESVQESVARMA